MLGKLFDLEHNRFPDDIESAVLENELSYQFNNTNEETQEEE